MKESLCRNKLTATRNQVGKIGPGHKYQTMRLDFAVEESMIATYLAESSGFREGSPIILRILVVFYTIAIASKDNDTKDVRHIGQAGL
jgi:hypothetical protein